MLRLSQIVVAPMLLLLAAASLVSIDSSVRAQPPGFDKGKGFDKSKGFEKGRGVDRSTEKAPTPAPPADPVKSLEDDLAKLKALEADILSQLKKLKETPATPTPALPTARDDRRGPGEAGPDRRGPGEAGPDRRGPGGFGPGGFGFRGQVGPGGPGGGTLRGTSMLAQGIARMFQSMSADQLKEVIGELEKLRAEKLRAAAPVSRPMERSGRGEGRPEPGGRGASQNDEILKRLDRLSQELDDIRKSLKR